MQGSISRMIRGVNVLALEEAVFSRSFAKVAAPEAPSVPSPYNLYFGEQMKIHKDGRKVANSWKSLPEEQKKAYEEKSEAIRRALEAQYGPGGLPKQRRTSLFDGADGVPRTGLNLFIQREMEKIKRTGATFTKALGSTAPDHLRDMVSRWRGLSAEEKQRYAVEVREIKAKLRPEFEEKKRLEKEAQKAKKVLDKMAAAAKVEKVKKGKPAAVQP